MKTASTTDSMRSTWRTADRSTWSWTHWLLELADAHPVSLDTAVPVHSKKDAVPHIGQLNQHVWVLFHAFIPVALHQAWISLAGREALVRAAVFLPADLQQPWLALVGHEALAKVAVFLLYLLAFNLGVVREIQCLRSLAHNHGFLDGDAHERDGVPDHSVGKVIASLLKTTGTRIALAVYLTYSPDEAPLTPMSDVRWWLWLALATGLYGIVLDFWFYWYHRAMHDVGPLWKFHRTHHLTKHPNPLLTAFGDHEQEFFDMVGVPLMTYLSFRALGMPLGFYDWWICHQYIVYTEVWGHSGIRVHGTPPSSLSWLLCAFDADIIVEDHDLHHRKGYRKSYNYGKQTRLWDRIFGTCHERIESVPSNIDYVNQTSMPII